MKMEKRTRKKKKIIINHNGGKLSRKFSYGELTG